VPDWYARPIEVSEPDNHFSGAISMSKGRIKKLFFKRGFGFIKSQRGYDIFFHHSVVIDRSFESLAVGQEVEFRPDATSVKGPRASAVTPV
jgi:cold shock CspA family protein